MTVFTITKAEATSRCGVQVESTGSRTDIIKIVEGGLFEAAGVKVGMTILKVGGVEIDGANHCTELLTKAEGAFEVEAEMLPKPDPPVAAPRRGSSFTKMFRSPSKSKSFKAAAAPATAPPPVPEETTAVEEKVEEVVKPAAPVRQPTADFLASLPKSPSAKTVTPGKVDLVQWQESAPVKSSGGGSGLFVAALLVAVMAAALYAAQQFAMIEPEPVAPPCKGLFCKK